jgi:glycogen debranching enzyme
MGPYLRAYLKLNGSSAPAKAHARDLLEPLLDHVTDACVGSISEIFDGAAPHRPRGAVSQAWSVAEVLDVLSDCEPGGDTT